MKPMHIALDLDDVILDYTGGVRAAVALEFGVEVPEFTDRNMGEVLNPIIGGKGWWDWMKRHSWLWSTFPAVPGAVGTIDQLRQAGFYLEVVTSKPKWAEANVWDWLGKWRLPVQRVTIVSPDDRKVDLTYADLLIDDKIDNCEEFVKAGRQAWLFERSHNRNLVVDSRVEHVAHWPEIRRRLLG